MTRLIDADTFLDEANNEDPNGILTFRDVALWIADTPTAAEVIRCWECKHSEAVSKLRYLYKCDEFRGAIVTRKEYCSRAERKEDKR